MKLLELEPRFIRIVEPGKMFRDVDLISEADGVLFLCPKCFQTNGGTIGTHSVICWRSRVPQTEDPKPGRWEFEGTGLHDLTLVAGSRSVLLMGGCNAHFFVRSGDIVMC